ncbi:MAG: sulfurtransferase TusA family protein [candidate division NC10 bacterium]|nr:sulfurtransferase TusA family protein [candidate division NC10 bacterium]
MAGNPQVVHELNLRGEVCPYTFIKSKLALEELEAGAILRVIVDNPRSAQDVPRSLAGEGNEVIEVTPLTDREWAIVVRKRWDAS